MKDKISTTKGMLEAWREAKDMQPGEGEAIFREHFGLKPKEQPTTQSGEQKFSPEFHARLKRLRSIDPTAAAAVDELIAERVEK